MTPDGRTILPLLRRRLTRLLMRVLTRPAGLLLAWALLVTPLLLAVRAGLLDGLQRGLAAAMARWPLPPAYFVTFILLGALLPLLLALIHRRQMQVRAVLHPYLLLLAGQILAETLVTRSGGLSLGVLVGTLFTLLRLVQLPLLWPLAAGRAWLHHLLRLQLLLWGINALQMLLFRWGPLLRQG